MPKISVIVPVYNAELCIARCVDSLLAQTFTDFELLLIDDGSTDKSGELCDKYAKKDNRITVIHKSNSGAAAARNTGIKAAKGDYIGFADSDDYVLDNYLEKLIKTAENNSADIVVCNYFSVTENGKPNKIKHGFKENTLLNRNDIEKVLYSNIFCNKNTDGYFSLWNKLFKYNLIKENNLLINGEMSFGEDMLFVMDCLKHCKNIAFTENAGYYYEMTEGGLFSKYRRGFINDIAKCYTSIIEQTATENYNENDLIPLSYKYWNYINRQIGDISEYEKCPFWHIYKVLRNKTVCKVFSVMANMPIEKANEIGISPNELKPARMIRKGFIFAAAFVADYQFNKNFWLRGIKK